MKVILLFFFLIIFSNCSKPKTVLICGDHICINKNEAKQYFQENLSIEVKIVDKKIKQKFDLVELNLKENNGDDKEVRVFAKKKTSQKLKTLSKEEINKIKASIKNKKGKKKITKKIERKKNDFNKKNIKPKNKRISSDNVNKLPNKDIDICTILKKCSIDEITKYLINQGKMKNFPDITLR